jgi:MYXO-CTERM domain-containing protein
MRIAALASAFALTLALAPDDALAFSTRVHIAIANKVREALVDAGDGAIPLRLSEESVVLSKEDFEAIRDNPLALRAGAIGPDNMVFPGMTDPSHALGQRPFEQCELLYQAALTGEERAYALGCFLHGATDAVAHHYVNYMTGETFTLTPISSARADGLDNVVRHILAESAIQEAAVAGDPAGFAASKLLHTIPVGFVLRTYLDPSSELWVMMSAHAKAEYDAVVADNPGASLPTIVAAMDVAPADHLVLSPIYLASVEALIDAKRQELEQAIAAMQDPNTPEGAELGVGPGGDGELGTKDDTTECTLTCAQLYATYFTYAGLLAPRYNAQDQPLPSAFEKITDELRAELFLFLPAYMETVEELSGALNQPPDEMDGAFGVSKDELAEHFAPLNDWADAITTIDYDTLVYAVVPDWIIELDTLLQSVGLDVDLAALLEAVFKPIVQPIKDAIQQAFIAQAQVFIQQLIDAIDAQKEPVYAEYDARLAAAAHPDLEGTALDHFYDSGLFAHAFNVTAAAFASHDAVLPAPGDPLVGPASFDASYTPAWMQAGLCDYLQPEIFPLGLDVRGALSVRDGGGDYPAQLDEDAPIECHDGSLAAFADLPSVALCVLTQLQALLDADPPQGSLSRAFPPLFAGAPATCQGAVVPGLPEPPDDSDSDSDSDSSSDASGGESDSGESDTSATSGGATEATSAGPDSATAGGDDPDGEGCGCRSDAQPRAPGLLMLGGLFLLGLQRRRRRAPLAALALAPAVTLAGCAGDDLGGTDTDASTSTTEPGTSTSTTSPGTSTSASSESDTDTDSDSDTEATTDDTDTDSTTSDTDTDTGGGVGELLKELSGSVWHGEQARGGKTRAYELRFDTDSFLWSELQNPYGPARVREMRAFKLDGDLFNTTVIQPPGWPVHPDNGRQDTWSLELIEGDPRRLRTTRDGVIEEFEEGPWPAPEDGLTATVRVFKVGGAVDKAFCDSGFSGFDYITLLDFARGKSDEIVATDVVAGAKLQTWTDPSKNNQFSVNDVHGFDQLGGTDLSDTFNFFVTYTGTVAHPGGAVKMREQDDSVEDAVWAFLNDKVGSSNVGDLFLEVQGFAWPDKTEDAPSATFPAGDLPIEAILVRCTEAIKDVDIQIDLGDGWQLVGDAPTQPVINTQLFPPAL